MDLSHIADLARGLEAARAVAANQYGRTHLGMVGNEVATLHEALAAYEKAEHIDGYETS